MAISLSHRQIGDITAVTCSGRIVEGDEARSLKEHFDTLEHRRYVVVHLGGVTFVDSAGLGLLVRLLTRAQRSGGDLKLCAVPPRIVEVLRMTRLQTILEAYDTEADAVASFYHPSKRTTSGYRFTTDILCADVSADLLAYVGQLLGQAGYGVVSAYNLPDAVILLNATRPRLVIVGQSIRDVTGTASSETFARLTQGRPVIDLPADFGRHEAGAAGEEILQRVRLALGPGSQPSSAGV
jgi:anti-sigma B factor antagonist